MSSSWRLKSTLFDVANDNLHARIDSCHFIASSRAGLFYFKQLKVFKKTCKSKPQLTMRKPKLLLMGPRRSGKSSIQSVIFHKMAPNDTLFLESTMTPQTADSSAVHEHDGGGSAGGFHVHQQQQLMMHQYSSFAKFEIWDLPGDVVDPAMTLHELQLFQGAHCSLVFVLDA